MRIQAHSALAEALVELDKSERECTELGVAVAVLNGQVSGARQQLAACYDAHCEERSHSKAHISALSAKFAALHEQKEALDIKLNNYYKDTILPGRDDGSSLEGRYQELVRRLTSHEVNELVLKRRHTIVDGELQIERDMRLRAEGALGDLIATMRGRILYLELWKQGASARFERFQAELDDSVPALHPPEYSPLQPARHLA